MPTIKDIAKAANVSYSTVSYVLGNRRDAGRISEKTRAIVMETATRLGYRKNRLASATRSGNSYMTAVLGEIRNGSFSGNVATVLPGIVQAASSAGNGAQIYSTDNLDEKINNILELQISQIIGVITNHQEREKLAELCKKNKLNLVFIYERGQGGFPAVSTDDRLGLRLAVDHLTSMGHERIALICGTHNFNYIRDRHMGYLDGLESAGLAPREDYIIHCDDLEPAIIDPMIESLLILPPEERPTAFCCIGGLHANSIMRVAAKQGIIIPDDLSIVTFGNSLPIEYAIVPLTTIDQPLNKLGNMAFDLLQSKQLPIAPDNNGDFLLPPTLIKRNSSGPPMPVNR